MEQGVGEIYVDKNGELLINTNEEEKNKKPRKKIKLYKVVVPLVLVGGITVTIIATRLAKLNEDYTKSNFNKKYGPNAEANFEYEITNDRTLSQLISTKEYNEFKKYRDLLEEKKKIDAIDLSEYSSYSISYDSITEERIKTLCEDYYKYYPTHDQNFYNTCSELKSISESIDKYTSEYGENLVRNMTARVLAAKAVDYNNLNPNNVDNISIDLSKKGDLKVNFDYFERNGIVVKYKSKEFKNQNSDFAGEIGDNLNNDELLEAIYNTQVLAADDDYKIGIKHR